MIKLFSGNILGTEFISALRPLFPDLLFMPTGGVNLDKENMAGGFKAGVCVVSMGSKLIRNQLLKQKSIKKLKK